jgi:hypothetical protein
MNKKKVIMVILCAVIILIGAVFVVGYLGHNSDDTNSTKLNVTNNTNNNTTQLKVENKEEKVVYSAYCMICGAGLSEKEANEEYTEGKICFSCANNPDYYTEEGSRYANEKLGYTYDEKGNMLP